MSFNALLFVGSYNKQILPDPTCDEITGYSTSHPPHYPPPLTSHLPALAFETFQISHCDFYPIAWYSSTIWDFASIFVIAKMKPLKSLHPLLPN